MRKATRNLAPIKRFFEGSPFAGEFCPFCEENRLTVYHRYPMCNQCQEKYHPDETLLKTLQGRRLHIEQEEINWEQKPRPRLTGTIDGIAWQANYVFLGWSVPRVYGDGLEESDSRLIAEYLNLQTPPFLEQFKQKKTKIRRYVFLAALGTGVLATASYLIAKNLAQKKTE
jgi:hypothetical protein